MDKSGFANNNINKKSGKHTNALYLIVKNSPGLTRYDTKKNILNISLKSKKSEINPNSFHSPWNCISFESFNIINNSATIKLANTVLQYIDMELLNSGTYQSLKTEFYSACINNLSNMYNDNELLLLYLKQTVLLLRSTSIFDSQDNISLLDGNLYRNAQLYLKMLYSFWNKMNWALLFPSMPESAANLMKNRKLLVDLLITKKQKTRIDLIANEFFKLTGSGSKNDILLISFLDFGVLTWLNHFGIINYVNGSDLEPVFIEVTKHGRRMLEYLSFE